MLTETLGGVLVDVRAYAGAKRNEVRGIHDGSLKVAVTKQPEKGKANKAIREQLAKSLQLKLSQIDLISGETSTTKKFLIQNIKIEELQKRIESLSKDMT
ncbi:MAG: DUF167 domain-containing protein [Planctomycetaceae bacterium]|jgi:uncharacterized protein (TIGR00251 family)|nr:DUF167 domain-containing protein [Planctomycetaceae bacterium]